MSTKYRLKAYDVANDIYYIEKRSFFMWWADSTYGAGGKEEMEDILGRLHGLQEDQKLT